MKHSFFGRKTRTRPHRHTRSQPLRQRTRRSFLEKLEDRHLLTGMPFGALPDDTGEYMLGDVYVNVVLMESDSSLAPFDQETEDWTSSEIADVKGRIAEGLKWWEDTLDGMENVRDGLLKYTLDFTHADTPVHTGYEPIARTSQEFSNWVYDFLGTVGFTQSGNFLTDLRAYNNAQRLAHNANWSFTIFVVDDSHDLATDFNFDENDAIEDYDGTGRFASGSAFSRSFAYAGGNGFVMPAGRPASTVAHETGHMFWALDEYNTGSTAWQLRRGYYNTPNTNSSSNPEPGFTQASSIMASAALLETAYAAHASSISSMEMIGWKDSDGDGIFDVLDVPFSLSGTGDYNSENSTFKFVGKSQVRTLENQNPSGLQDDITINQIDRAEYSIDGGAWITAGTYHKYTIDLNFSIPVSPGASQIRIRTVDDRTGVMSVEYVANLGQDTPQSSPQPGISGYVFSDGDGSGSWEGLENGLAGWVVRLVNSSGQPVDLRRRIEPNEYGQMALLNNVASPGVILSAVGGDVADANVYSRVSESASAAGKVFANNSASDGRPMDTWTSGRKLRADFSPGTSEVNITAISSGVPGVGRLEIYNGAGELLARYTTAVLTNGKSEVMKLVRPQGDIAYAIASGHAGTKVVLDTLEWGPLSSAVTNQFGYYSLSEIPAGLYRVAALAKPYFTQMFPSTGIHLINVPNAINGVENLNFGFLPLLTPWRNPDNALDVNDDGKVSAIDSLSAINYINSHEPNDPLPSTHPEGGNYYDVNNDGFCTAADVLMVINELNRTPPPSPTGEGPGDSSGGIGGGGLGGSAGGEYDPLAQPLTPGADLAAQYYSRSPLQVLDVPGSAGCHCEQCTAITEVASSRVNATQAPAAFLLPLESQSFSAAKKEAALLGRHRESSPHIDISLLDTLAAAVSNGEDAKAGRRGRR